MLNRATSFDPEEFAPKKRTMSAEGTARIAATQKKRWATQKAAIPDRKARKQVLPVKRTSKTIPPKAARQDTASMKNEGKKSLAKTTIRPVTKTSAKQARKAAPESQVAA